MTKQVTASIHHKTKNTWYVRYSFGNGCGGSCMVRGVNIDEVKKNAEKHYRFKNIKIVWE